MVASTTSWLNGLGQKLAIAGVLKKPTSTIWNFVSGVTATWNEAEGRWDLTVASGVGSGDFVGPAGATSGNIVTFGSGTGKLGADSGVALAALELAARPQSTYTAASNAAALLDARKCVITTRATAISLRLRLQASIAWLADTLLGGINTGAGTLTLTAEGGVTLNGSVTVPQNGWWWAKRTAANTWQCFTGGTGGGDLLANGSVPFTGDQSHGNHAITGIKSAAFNGEIDNATSTIDFTTGALQKKTLAANTTLATPTPPAPFTDVRMRFAQPASGGTYNYTLTFWAGISWVGSVPTMPTGAGVELLVGGYHDGTTWRLSAYGGAGTGTGDIKSDGSVAFAANQSMGSHKLTSLTNGSAASDAAAFGQIPTVGGAPANVTKATASAGVAATWSASDHKHDVSTAAPGALTLSGVAAAEGSATSLARSDHAHSITGVLALANGGEVPGIAVASPANSNTTYNISDGNTLVISTNLISGGTKTYTWAYTGSPETGDTVDIYVTTAQSSDLQLADSTTGAFATGLISAGTKRKITIQYNGAVWVVIGRKRLN